MKKLFALIFLLGTLCAGAAYAQDEAAARDLYSSYAKTGTKGRPGARISIELLRGGQTGFVPLDTGFKAGDKVKLHFELNFPAYVEIYNLGTSGRLQRLFPAAGVSGPVKIVSGYTVPAPADEWLRFDQRAGIERLSFVFSAAPVAPPKLVAAQKRPPASAKPKAKGDAAPAASDTQQALDDLNAREMAGDAEGRDFDRVRVGADAYVLSNQQRLRRALYVSINLQHR
ncbi:MAG: DUF4384 domain-containing protein [Acidobacteria bacterium]|nr:DUF4384 domain-containing protein [Acidobacteriota bacterium]MBI3421810.1 DUF4384 domain-containing protein [Acidobacteriota bacterium]